MLTAVQGLQLLEFLIKNGSERVIDDARSHLSLLKMLRQFHFIDQNGKDQGVNVRNRSKELAELLGDVDRIRAERKKARNNRTKFGGVEGGAMSSGLSSGSKYGGFGNDDSSSYGAYSGGVYGDGGGYGGNTSGFQDSSSRRDRFEEYDEYDEGVVASPTRRKTEASTLSSTAKREPKKAEPPKKKEPEIDILGFDDDDVPPETPPKESSSNKKAGLNVMDDLGAIQSSGAADDDFDDFQSATPAIHAPSKQSTFGLPPPLPAPSSNQYAASKPTSAFQSRGLTDLVGFQPPNITSSPAGRTDLVGFQPSNTTSTTAKPFISPSPAPFQAQQPLRPTGYQAPTPNYFTSVPAPNSSPSITTSNHSSTPAMNKAKPSSSTAGADAFGSLWSSASASAGIKKTASAQSSQGPNLASLAKEKASAGIWGASPAPMRNGGGANGGGAGNRPGGQKSGGGLDDLLG